MTCPVWINDIAYLPAFESERLAAQLAAAQGIADARMTRIEELEAAIREAKLAIACGGATMLVIDRVIAALDPALGATVEPPVSTLCAVCDQIKELHPASHPWTAKETPLSVSTTGTVRRSVRDMVFPRSESETDCAPRDLMIDPQPTWIESSGRWKYPLKPPHDNDGKCPAVYTASREWWEYLPAGAFPAGCNMAAQKPDGRWFWCFASDRGGK
jgi:hypothetical protein